AAVDLCDDLQHAVAFFDGGLVQRPRLGEDFAVEPGDDLDGLPLLHAVAAAHDAVHGAGDVGGLGFGEEADVAEVHSQQRCPDGPGELGGAQQGAVTAEHHHQLGVLGGLRTRGQDLTATGTERGPATWPSLVRDSAFPDGPGSGRATTPRTDRSSPAAAAATSRTARARSSGSLTTPLAPTLPYPTSNWGLTSRTRSARDAEHRTSAGSTRRSEMNERSPTTSVGGSPTCSGVSERTFTRSMTVTRSSVRSDQASCP